MSGYLQKFYDHLLKIDIKLEERRMDEPHYVKSKRIEIQHLLSTVDRLSLKVTQLLSRVETDLTRERFEYTVKKNHAVTQNQQIKQLPSQKEREAAVEVLYEDDLRRILEKENEFIAHKHLKEAIKDRRSVLTGARSTIVEAIKLIDTEARGANIGAPTDPDVKDLYKGLEEVEREEALNQEIDIDGVESAFEEVNDSEGPVEADKDFEIDENAIESSIDGETSDVEIEAEEGQDEVKKNAAEGPNSQVDLSEVEGESSAQTGDKPDTGEDSQADQETSDDSGFDIESLYMQDDEDELSASEETEDTDSDTSGESEPEEVQNDQHIETKDESSDTDINDLVGDASDIADVEGSSSDSSQKSEVSSTDDFDFDIDISEGSSENITEETPDQDLESLIATEDKPKSSKSTKKKDTKTKVATEDEASISETGIDIDDILNDIDI